MGQTGRIITIANQKGGVGKTTTAHALVTGLAAKGYKTLAVDTDPQSNLTVTMAADETQPGIYELLKRNVEPREAIQHTPQGDIIGASLMLAGADIEFNSVGREYLLLEALEPLKQDYDFIVIDSPPTLGILTINALTAAADLIIPMGADAYSLQGLAQLYTTITTVKRRCNPNLKIAGVLITRYSGRAILSQDLRETIKRNAAQIGANTFETRIREGVAVKEAQIRQESIYASRSNPSVDYRAFVDEYVGKEVAHIES